MPARARMNALADRKRALLAEAELHRRVLARERLHLGAQAASIRAHVAGHRWWWIGGAALAGWLVFRGARGLTRWLPAATTIFRLVRGLRNSA